MNDELMDALVNLDDPGLFWFQVSNVTRGYYRGDGWLYHEGNLHKQLSIIVAQHRIKMFDEEYQEIIEPLPKDVTELLMFWLLDGDYDPQLIRPLISNLVPYSRKQKKRDIGRDFQKQVKKRLSRWVLIPA